MLTGTAAKFSFPLCALALLLSYSAVQGQEASLQQYEVELVIFRVNNPGGTPEDWALEETKAKTSLPQNAEPEETTPTSTEAAPPAVPPAAESSVQPLAGGPTRLTSIEAALRKNRAYTPVAHIGWTQPGFARNAAKYLSVTSLVPASSGLQGQIALSRGRYLHLTLDLVLDSQGESAQSYVLRQTRRMRSNERHYIDSPKFGVIAVITPTGSGDAAASQ